MTEALQQEIRTLKTVFESDRDPEGRVFAPLADAYRRAGEIQQAVRLLSEGLARHPDFVPGHVVAAQLYVEQGLAEEAAIAARHALELDEENVNALRSLLRVLEERQDDEADAVRARLEALEPDLAGDGSRGTVLPPPEATEPAASSAATGPAEVDSEAETVELAALGGAEPPALQATAAMDAVPSEVEGSDLTLPGADAAETDAEIDEPLIDLDTLGPLEGTLEIETPGGPDDSVDPLADSAMALDVEEPVVDLDSLAPVSDEVEAEDLLVTSDAGLEPSIGLPSEEPVMELDDLAPAEAAFDEAVTDEAEEFVSPADLSPDAEAETLPLSALAPDEPEEAPVMELADLAPDAGDDDATLEISALAPEPDEADEPVELADLAPDAEDEPVVELADLAPGADGDEDIAEPVMELADLAPQDEPEAAVMELSELAPDASEDELTMELADLAPDTEDDDATLEISALAPETDEAEESVELADLAPDEEDDSVVDLALLAPDGDDESDEPVMELPELAPDPDEEESAAESEREVTMMDLMAQTPASADEPQGASADELVEEPDEEEAFVEASEEEPGEESEEESDAADDDESPGEPVYTRTLAELYVKQGAIERAIEVYRHLSERRPDDESLSERLAELEAGEGLEPEPEPVLSGRTEEEVETLARELAENGDDAPEPAESPYTLHEPDDAGPDEESPDGPSIGEYFEDLLNWKPERQA